MWKSYGAHALAYVIYGLVLAQKFAPAAIPGKGILIAAGAGILLTAIHNLQTLAANSTTTLPPPSAGTMKTLMPFALLLMGGLLVTCSVTGCATLAKIGTPTAQPYVTDAVDTAVLGAEIAGVPAAEINRISKLALAADQGTAATLATVAGVINAELAKLTNLTDPERSALSVLEQKLSAALQAQIDKNPNVATTQAVVADMLNEAIKITGS